MTDKAVSALTSLTGANTATGDLVYIVDISEAAAADRSKKITLQELFLGIPAGAVATPSIAAQGDQNTGIWFPAADTIAASTGGIERARITSGGDFRVKGAGTAGSTDAFQVAGTAPADAARITSGGDLLVGTTSIVAPTTGFTAGFGGSYAFTQIGHPTGTGSGATYSNFLYDGSSIGSITQSGTSAVAYNTSSDYRLKNTIAPMTGALAKVALLKPCTYKWNADGSDGEGFIAHELAEVVPQCVTGEKDAVDAEGKPQYQGIDTSFLVATLTAAIKEQQALIESLTARVAQLEQGA
jgi:hypothetical protein